MDNKDLQVLKKISEHISAVISYCINCDSLDDFQADSMRIDACVFNLMQIGELAKTALSDDIKAQITSIPWKQL